MNLRQSCVNNLFANPVILNGYPINIILLKCLLILPFEFRKQNQWINFTYLCIYISIYFCTNILKYYKVSTKAEIGMRES